MEPPNATREFLGDEAQRAAARIALDDVQGLWGGRKIRVDGSGWVSVRVVERGMVEQRYEFGIEAEAWEKLLEIVMQSDFVTIQPPDRMGIPDEARPEIALINARGESRAVSKWAGVRDDRFEAVYVALVQIEALTLGLEPVFSGPYVPGT